MNRSTFCALSIALCLSLLVAPRVEAFVVRPSPIVRLQSTTTLHAKKKRRRKQQADNAPDISSLKPSSSSKELPDFDLNDDESNESASTPSNKSSLSPPPSKEASMKSAASAVTTKVTTNMMGSTEKPARSIQELISDRSLEQKLEFDDIGASDQDVPDLLQIARSSGASISSSSSSSSEVAEPGSKRARQEARRAAAQARDQKEAQEQENPFAKLPFITDEDGKVLPLKVIEAGTWAGIFLLVAWEVYINSPLFERAAPMAPVVY